MLSVYTTWQDVPRSLTGTVIVIDVLRWSTSTVTALAHGALCVEAFATPEAATERARNIGALTAGERNSHRIAGFDLGNSPAEYTADVVRGKTICSTTTNGTHALLAARSARTVFVGAFVNLVPTAAAALATGDDISIICAGQAGREALEDTACAGAIIEWLLAAHALNARELDASAAHARNAWVTNGRDPHTVFRRAPHASSLVSQGYEADLHAAANLNTSDVIAIANANTVRQLTTMPEPTREHA